jgi:hypothetical protein
MSYTNEFEQHPDITSTRAWTPEFLEAFRQAYQAYESGQWAQAKELLERTKVCREMSTLHRSSATVGSATVALILMTRGSVALIFEKAVTGVARS